MNKHSIIVIKNEKNEYLQYFDKKWDSYLFMNCKMKDKDDVDSIYNELKQSLGLNKEEANLSFVAERVHRKFSESAKGWKKELNLISWNGAAPKYDLRDWSPEHEKMGKGITLSPDEVQELYKLLSKIVED